MFQILGVNGPIPGIELDDIYFTGGAALTTNIVTPDVLPAVSLSWPTVSGTNYTVQVSTSLNTNAVWSTVAGPMAGNGSTTRLYEMLNPSATRFYRILQTH